MTTLVRVLMLMVVLCAVGPVAAEEAGGPPPTLPQLDWVRGPTTAKLGDVAEIKVPEGYAFLASADTRKLLEAMGNRTSGNELGLVAVKESQWFAIFEWHAVGYVKDDDSDIDASALLKSISEATEEGNEWRKQHGATPMHVDDWVEKPHYDATTHNLVWGLGAHDDEGAHVVNYNVRLLGRHGYMSITLVESPEGFAAARAGFAQMLTGFGYVSGGRYAEYVSGDRLAEVGLAALVAGGAGAAAAKLGLFGKLGKLIAAMGKGIIVFVLAILAAVRRFFVRLANRGVEPAPSVEGSSTPE
jgi:uncharacterized membrane-anchored protein